MSAAPGTRGLRAVARADDRIDAPRRAAVGVRARLAPAPADLTARRGPFARALDDMQETMR